MEQKSALPLIRFWLDVESFKSSTQQCQTVNRSKQSSLATKSTLGRSVSLDANLLNRDDFPCNYIDSRIDEEFSETNLNELSTEQRDNGDGSSDANSIHSMTSDDYEHNGDIEVENLYENGRKSATGASDIGNGDEVLNKQVKYSMPTSSIVDAIRIFKKYLLHGELGGLVRIPTNILSEISLLLCVQNDLQQQQQQHLQDNEGDRTDSNDKVLNVGISTESLSLSSLQESTNLDSVFDAAQSYVLDYLNDKFTNGFLESHFYYQFCIENAGKNLKITDILHNEAALFYFMEFLEIENKRHYLDFWLGAMNFKRQLDYYLHKTSNELDNMMEQSTEQITFELSQNDALILYEKYFSLQATHPLHLSDQVRFHVEEKICSIDCSGSIAHCFDLPLAIIEHFLREKYLDVFQQSNLFYKYIGELLQKIESMKSKAMDQQQSNASQTQQSTTHTAAAISVAKAPSRKSISTKNTLLAMESVKKRKSGSTASDMCIDSRQMHDPELLWQRNSMTKGLKFGRVNAFGRYERDYDMIPFDRNHPTQIGGNNDNLDSILHNTGNKIKRAVRKLVHLPEQCMQEELAWQMAEMIIKDVTNVTLHNQDSFESV